MNISEQILIIDVNVIIHLEKVGLLNILVNDKNIRIVDLVLYQEYQYKPNLASKYVEKIELVHLSDKQLYEANDLYLDNPRNSVYDYYSYIAAKDNNYILLSGDWKLKKVINDVEVHGVVWYVGQLNKKGIIDDNRLKKIYKMWLNDPTVYIKDSILKELIDEV